MHSGRMASRLCSGCCWALRSDREVGNRRETERVVRKEGIGPEPSASMHSRSHQGERVKTSLLTDLSGGFADPSKPYRRSARPPSVFVYLPCLPGTEVPEEARRADRFGRSTHFTPSRSLPLSVPVDFYLAFECLFNSLYLRLLCPRFICPFIASILFPPTGFRPHFAPGTRTSSSFQAQTSPFRWRASTLDHGFIFLSSLPSQSGQRRVYT